MCKVAASVVPKFLILILTFFSRFKVLSYRYVDMGRNSRSRSTRRTHIESGRRRSPRRSPRERSPRRSPRGDSRYRSDHRRLQTDKFDTPSSWNSSDTHWDTKTEYGLNFPKRVESTQFSRRQNLAGQEITQVKLVDVVQSGISNWGLRLVANGRFVSCEFFRNRVEATFATALFREMSKQKDTLDFNKLLGVFTPQSQDPQEWDTKMTSIKGLVQSTLTLDHFRTLCPQDSQQAILEELEKLKAEKAALKASQAPGSGGQPSQNTQSPPTGQPQINFHV